MNKYVKIVVMALIGVSPIIGGYFYGEHRHAQGREFGERAVFGFCYNQGGVLTLPGTNYKVGCGALSDNPMET
jgi:hypothetical protein